jgi:hypothetical protein
LSPAKVVSKIDPEPVDASDDLVDTVNASKQDGQQDKTPTGAGSGGGENPTDAVDAVQGDAKGNTGAKGAKQDKKGTTVEGEEKPEETEKSEKGKNVKDAVDDVSKDTEEDETEEADDKGEGKDDSKAEEGGLSGLMHKVGDTLAGAGDAILGALHLKKTDDEDSKEDESKDDESGEEKPEENGEDAKKTPPTGTGATDKTGAIDKTGATDTGAKGRTSPSKGATPPTGTGVLGVVYPEGAIGVLLADCDKVGVFMYADLLNAAKAKKNQPDLAKALGEKKLKKLNKESEGIKERSTKDHCEGAKKKLLKLAKTSEDNTCCVVTIVVVLLVGVVIAVVLVAMMCKQEDDLEDDDSADEGN